MSPMASTDQVGSGQLRRVEIGGEYYYLILTDGPSGPHLCCACPRENAPERREMRAVLETVCNTITEMMRGNG